MHAQKMILGTRLGPTQCRCYDAINNRQIMLQNALESIVDFVTYREILQLLTADR